uniref:Putative alpha-L-fucosidase n=1 Tax=Caenorhabditis japonica TaxID=281687 RepID=A0A8R1HGR6_CAEJA
MWWYWKGTQPDKDVVNFVEKNYKPGTTYADFAKDFTAEYFDPNAFVQAVQSSGARYFVFTSKHHEGFTMWPSKTSWNWNSVDIGPKRDIVGELRNAFKQTKIHFGLYFSQFEWFNPLFLDDGKFNTTLYPEQVSYPQMIEIVTKYRPDVVWSDGEWDKSDDYWRAKDFLAWLYNSSPVKDDVVVNDRWGAGTMGKHGGFMTYSDHYDPGTLLARKWENCMTLDKHSWGNRRNMRASEVYTAYEIIEQIARTVACNGNLLLNIGPDMHGRIPPIFEDRLAEIGRFIDVHSEALFGTKPWIFQNDTNAPNVWYTSRYRPGSSNRVQKYREAEVFNRQVEKETTVYAWILSTSAEKFELKSVKTTERNSLTQSLATTALTAGIPSLVDRHFTGSDDPYVLHGNEAGRSVVTPVFRGFFKVKSAT